MLPNQEYQMWSDAKLLELLGVDDRKAFELLYKKYSGKSYAAAYSLFRDKDVCEDQVQDLFVDLWAKRHELNITSLEWYLKVAIKNRVLMYIRTRRATLDVSALEALAAKYSTDSLLIQHDIGRVLDENVAQLPEKCRQVFTLSRKECLSNKEIAARLGISVKTVENQMTIALRYLRSGLTDYLPSITILLLVYLAEQ